jgi:oxygen-independent coproporphyrinogen-3 oxidase
MEARDAGFKNISLDLIYGLPGQTLDQWIKTVEDCLALTPEHVSVYGLTLEEGTLFYESQEAGTLTLPGEHEQTRMYRASQKLLLENGFNQYEISNYARPGYHSRHNLTYWTDGDYLGLGASAHSHLNGKRFANCFDPQDYIQRILQDGTAVAETEHLTPEQKAREAMAFGLRRTAGFNLQTILQRYGVDFPQAFYNTLEDLQAQGLLTSSNKNIRLTSESLLLADELASTLIFL